MHTSSHRLTTLATLAILLVLLVWFAGPATAAEHDLILTPDSTELTFLLEATGHDVEGKLYLQEGNLHYDTATGAASGRIVLGAPRTETGNEKRDKTMHKKVLESALYPEIVFVPSKISGPVEDSGAGHFDLQGIITLHGKDHDVSMPTEVKIDDSGRIDAHATLDVPFVEWGLEDPSILFLRVAKVVQVDIRFTAPIDGAADDAAMAQDSPEETADVTAREGSR